MATREGMDIRALGQRSAKGLVLSWGGGLLRFVARKPLGAAGMLVLVVFGLAAIFAPFITSYHPYKDDTGFLLHAPSVSFPFGTDNYGRDVYTRVVYGARTSLTVGLGTIGAAITVATLLGLLSGYLGGWFDLLVQRVVDAVMAVPALVLLLAIMSVLGPGLLNVIIALSFRACITESRIIRSAVLAIKEYPYVEAARAVGATNLRIMVLHIAPNIMAPVIVMASLGLGGAILAEATLSFLGYGVPPPEPTWGGMLSGEARRFMLRAPWLAIFPGVALSLVVFGINVFGDALRDVLDPRLRGR